MSRRRQSGDGRRRRRAAPPSPPHCLSLPLPSRFASPDRHASTPLQARTGGVSTSPSGSPELIVKPALGGSSIGVSAAASAAAAAIAAAALSATGSGDVVVEGLARGAEFSVIVLGGGPGGAGAPVALVPSEVELTDRSPAEPAAAAPEPAERGSSGAGAQHGGKIFGYREKYLPTAAVRVHTPPRFPTATVARIRRAAEAAFAALGLRDFARLDGALLSGSFLAEGNTSQSHRPAATFDIAPPAGFLIPGGSLLAARVLAGARPEHRPPPGGDAVVFTDVNIISGTEQTSFLFVQAAEARRVPNSSSAIVSVATRLHAAAPAGSGRPEGRDDAMQMQPRTQVGVSHAMLVRHLVGLACNRAGPACSPTPAPPAAGRTEVRAQEPSQSAEGLKVVRVIFGGEARCRASPVRVRRNETCPVAAASIALLAPSGALRGPTLRVPPLAAELRAAGVAHERGQRVAEAPGEAARRHRGALAPRGALRGGDRASRCRAARHD